MFFSPRVRRHKFRRLVSQPLVWHLRDKDSIQMTCTYFRHLALDTCRYLVYLFARIRAVCNIDRPSQREARLVIAKRGTIVSGLRKGRYRPCNLPCLAHLPKTLVPVSWNLSGRTLISMSASKSPSSSTCVTISLYFTFGSPRPRKTGAK